LAGGLSQEVRLDQDQVRVQAVHLNQVQVQDQVRLPQVLQP
jgi:hypothetical protein